MPAPQTVLVTGCSSGLGRTMSETLARQGHTVVATLRDARARNLPATMALEALAQQEGLALHVVEMDVTDDASVERAVQQAAAISGRLDVIVNNAGTMAMGLSEALPIERMRQMFEVNVLGAFRVNRAALPHLRQQGSGYLIYLSSSGGSVVYPFMGMYGATKAALNAMAEAWHYELFGLGIDTTIIQAGTYATALPSNVFQSDTPQLTEAYGAVGAMAEAMNEGFGAAVAAAGEPAEVAHLVTQLVATVPGQRPLFAPVGPYTEPLRGIDDAHEAFQHQVLGMMGWGSLLTRPLSA